MVQVRLGAPINLLEMTFILPFILFFFSGFTSLLIKNRKILGGIFIAVSLVAFLLNLNFLFSLKDGLEINYIFGGFARELGIEYSLNAFNASVLTFLTFLIFCFSIFFFGFTRTYEKDFNFNILFCIIQVFCGAITAVLLTHDLFNFYIFFELMAICTYCFIALGGKGGSYASLNYLILGVIASGFIVIGIGFLYFSTGFLNIFKVVEVLKVGPNINLIIAFVFILVGFLIKLGFFPFAFWPGLVYKYFPSGIMPLYAGVISIVTLYGFNLFFGRFFLFQEFTSNFKNLILVLTIFGVLLFSFFSLFENDVRKIFAYSTIAQVSYALFFIFATRNEVAGLSFLHLFFNGISKLALFVILFEVTKNKGSYMISAFDGLLKKSPLMGFSTLFLFAGIIGLPLTFGFFTKISIILASFKLDEFLFIALILIGAVLNFLYFFKIASSMFFKKKLENENEISLNVESKIVIIISIVALVLATLFFSQISSWFLPAIKQFYFGVL